MTELPTRAYYVNSGMKLVSNLRISKGTNFATFLTKRYHLCSVQFFMFCLLGLMWSFLTKHFVFSASISEERTRERKCNTEAPCWGLTSCKNKTRSCETFNISYLHHRSSQALQTWFNEGDKKIEEDVCEDGSCNTEAKILKFKLTTRGETGRRNKRS